jgi:hypothetical protein
VARERGHGGERGRWRKRGRNSGDAARWLAQQLGAGEGVAVVEARARQLWHGRGRAGVDEGVSEVSGFDNGTAVEIR